MNECTDRTFRLLRPEEVISQWDWLSSVLDAAVAQGKGEVRVDDIRTLVLSGRMFVFASDRFALTCEFICYPQKTVMVAGFGAGFVGDYDTVEQVLIDFAKRGGASSIQTYVKNPAMVRYYRRRFNLQPAYSVLEKPL